MDPSRRSFLISASAFAGMAFLSACSQENAGNKTAPAPSGNKPDPEPTEQPEPLKLEPGHRGTLIGGGGRKRGDDWEYYVVFIDLDHIRDYADGVLQPRGTPIHFRAHAVVPHPVERHKAAVFEKWGPGAVEIDMNAMAVTRQITTVPHRMFYGHGAWSSDGRILYAVESEDPARGAYDGVVAVRDAADLRIVGEFPTYGQFPHDCHILDDGKTLAITNGGDGNDPNEPGCVTFVDIASEKLIERVTIPELMAGHLAITGESSKGDLAVGCTPYTPEGKPKDFFKTIPGGIALRGSGGQDIALMANPRDVTNQMLGETLSLVIHDELNIAGATTPAGNVVTFWDVKTNTLLKKLDLPMARGIALTLDKKYFAVTYGAKSELVLVRAKDQRIVEESRIAPTLLTGSHAISYDL